MAIALPTIGMFYEQEPETNVVVGRSVAVDGFVLALAAYAESFRYELFTDHRIERQVRRSHGHGAVGVQNRRALAEALRTIPPAAWHATEFEPQGAFAVRERAARPFPVTMVHHTISYKELRHSAVLPLLLADTREYDALICTSSAAGQALRNLAEQVGEQFNAAHGTHLKFRGRYETIPLGVDTERFRPIEQAEVRKQFGLEEDAFVMLWIGRLSLIDKADLLPLVRVTAQLKAENPGRKIRLVCAGTQRPGEQFGDLIETYASDLGVADSVRVLTAREQFMPWMPQLYNAADVFVSPADNIQETFGLTVIEAMSCGVPQVVADWNGYRDTVVEGETGLRVPTWWGACDAELDGLSGSSAEDHLALAQSVAMDPWKLAEAIQTLMDHEDMRKRMSEASRRRAVEVYDWSVVIGQYEALWRELGEQAKEDGAPLKDASRYLHPQYAETFGHYATQQLGGDTQMKLTGWGRELFRGQALLPLPYNAEWRYLDETVLRRILTGFAKTGESGGGMMMARLVQVMTRGAADQTAAGAMIARHVLWLIKYGYVAVDQG